MKLEQLRHPKAGIPTIQHVYRDASGAAVLIANRYEPTGKDKFFLPYDVIRQEWKAPASRTLYNLDKITIAAPETPVWFVEGEKCADALSALGFLATTSFGGCNALAKTDLTPLYGRRILVWPDNDEPGQNYATQIDANSCHFASIHIISPDILRHHLPENSPDIAGFNPVKGWDVADAIASGWTKEMINQLQSAIFAPGDIGLNQVKTGDLPLKQVKTCEFTPDSLELWHSPEREAFASITVRNHVENWAISSNAFKELLSYQHYHAEGKMLTAAALDDRRRALQGEALFAGETHKVFLRMGEIGRTLYLNLGNKAWQAVAIDAQGWQVIDRPPARFQRSASMAPLPTPMRHPDGIEALRPFLNVANDDDFKMLVAWLFGCFHPRGPYPILILTGEQGSAKSTTARVLRSLIDPANPMARSAPYSEQDLVIAAKHNHVMAFDNLSTIKPAMADALCRIATGGGFGTRKLHSDSDEVLFTATRPILLNGIPDLANRPDLADRAVIVTLPVISTSNRQFEAEFWKAFERAAPGILAALLDATTTALARIGTVTLPERPRMADFAKWATAAEPAFGWPDGGFMEAYARNRQTVQNAAIDGNPLAEAILQLAALGAWAGTATELLTTLREIAPMLTDDPHTFPRQPNRLTSELKRIQPLLRSRQVELRFGREGASGQRVIRVECA